MDTNKLPDVDTPDLDALTNKFLKAVDPKNEEEDFVGHIRSIVDAKPESQAFASNLMYGAFGQHFLEKLERSLPDKIASLPILGTLLVPFSARISDKIIGMARDIFMES